MRRLQIDLRTSNPQYDALMADGAWTGWLKSFPIANPSNAIDPLTGAAVANILIDATARQLQHFGTISPRPPRLPVSPSPRISTALCHPTRAVAVECALLSADRVLLGACNPMV